MQRRDRAVGIAIRVSETTCAERVIGQIVVDVQEVARMVGHDKCETPDGTRYKPRVQRKMRRVVFC